MQPHTRDTDVTEHPGDMVMDGDGVVTRDAPRPTMTADGAVVEPESPDDMVMTGDGAARRDGPRPEMTADGAKAAVSEEDEPGL
jgi:hypothetical protein